MSEILKYKRENHFFNEIKPIIDKLLVDDSHYLKHHLSKKMHIYNLTRPALKINDLENIKKILNEINFFFNGQKNDINNFLRIYINRNSTPLAQAASTNLTGSFSEKTRLYVILTQHFMNELTYKEQLAVVSHEYAHYYFEHTKIPYSRITKRHPTENIDDKVFILNLKKWGICREISSDLCALQITKSYNATALALIKLETGIMKDADIILTGLELYFNKLQNYHQSDVLKEHPLTLLRVLILKRVYKYCSDNKWKNINHDEIQEIVDKQIMLIYPEIIHDKNKHNIDIIIDLGLLVSIADGEINLMEVDYLKELIKSQQIELKDFDKKVKKLKSVLNTANNIKSRAQIAKEIIDKNLPDIIDTALKLNQDLHISSIVRNLLTLASADGKIDRDELNVIFSFAKEFSYSKEDLVQQMFNLK